MSAVRALRETLGDRGMAGLEEVVNDAGGRYFASVRTGMANEFAVVRTEMARMQTELMKWSFLFWVGQVAAMTAITALLLRTIR